MKDQKGHALLLALLVLGVSTLLALPFMRSAQVSGIASRSYPGSPTAQAASEAGVEDAIWRLTKGDLAAQLEDPGDSVSYSLDHQVNGVVPQVSVTRDHLLLASDDFESGDWAGGTGWLQDWDHQGSAAIVGSDNPQQGYYHLVLNGDNDYVKRSLNLSSTQELRLYFWAKASSFQSGEEVRCLVSSNGTDWTVVKTWANGDDDDIYRFYDIDLPSYEANGQLWIAFQAYMTTPDSYFYLDSLAIVDRFPGAVWGEPEDDFESGDWNGGTGWVSQWEESGRAFVTWLGWPHQGDYHMALLGPNGYAERRADLRGRQNAKLRFWVKASWFEEGDRADCLVSGDGINWLSLISWTVDDSDWEYHFVEVDIPKEVRTDQFRVAFEANMSSLFDFFYVDQLEIVGSPFAYRITSTASNTTTTAYITIKEGQVSIHSWQTETIP